MNVSILLLKKYRYCNTLLDGYWCCWCCCVVAVRVYVMLRKHWRTGVTRKRVLMTLGSSALVTWDWDTGCNSGPLHHPTRYMAWLPVCLVQTVSSLPEEKSWAFITGSVDSECFLITLLLLGRLKTEDWRLSSVRGYSASAKYNYSIQFSFLTAMMTPWWQYYTAHCTP